MYMSVTDPGMLEQEFSHNFLNDISGIKGK